MHTQSAASEEYCSFTRIHAIRPAKKGLLGLHLLATILGIAAAISASVPVAQAQALAKEYVYFAGRLVAVDVQGNTPTADSQTVITNSQSSVVITLTGSDPAGGDLTFSIPNPPDPGAPTKGTLSGLTPIVPAPIPHREPPPATVQPPVASATVTYTPNNPGANEEDSFTFTVADPGGLTDTAAVAINPFDTSPPAPPLSSVDATDVSLETGTDTATAMRLAAGGPNTVTLTFRVETYPLAH